MDELLEERRGAVALLTLHRPERLNAVSAGLYTRLCEAMARAEQDRSVRAVVLTGAGRAFCVGADLVAHREDRPGDARRAYVELGQRAARALLTSPLPVVAAVNGHAVGAGLELALACDLIVVAEAARLRFPELGLGTFVGGGATRTLVQRAGLTRARELLLLGRFFGGADAVALGVANATVPAADVLPAAVALAEELATKAPRSLAFAKQLLAPAALDEALAAEAEALLACMQTRDWHEGVLAFAEKRDPRFTGD